MAIKYVPAPDIEEKARRIAALAGVSRDFTRIHFVRSRGSTARRTIARCHGTPKIMQVALGTKAQYVIEAISERFDKMSEKDQAMTIIHELLHVPKGMKGGFRQHDFVCRKNVEELYRKCEKGL